MAKNQPKPIYETAQEQSSKKHKATLELQERIRKEQKKVKQGQKASPDFQLMQQQVMAGQDVNKKKKQERLDFLAQLKAARVQQSEHEKQKQKHFQDKLDRELELSRRRMGVRTNSRVEVPISVRLKEYFDRIRRLRPEPEVEVVKGKEYPNLRGTADWVKPVVTLPVAPKELVLSVQKPISRPVKDSDQGKAAVQQYKEYLSKLALARRGEFVLVALDEVTTAKIQAHLFYQPFQQLAA